MALRCHSICPGSKSLRWRRLTDGSTPDEDPRWFPDGRAIAYASDHGGGLSAWRITLDGNAPTLLLRDARDPAVSPDSKQLAFTRMGPRGYLRVGVASLADTSKQTMITRDEDGRHRASIGIVICPLSVMVAFTHES